MSHELRNIVSDSTVSFNVFCSFAGGILDSGDCETEDDSPAEMCVSPDGGAILSRCVKSILIYR